ncbi:ABC-ATPase domain-containing protein [Schaalia sp. lx-100]|uniref:ABC-ATPase domain-containing protein n=1 Tax=Schaalia sp. lx-100 TaxID=2899081 RepID=UPI001E5101D7|nr:ABC-ATPase domain-containing protein [Schaalia sp. lx-100]MCD4557922.1 ABC-ATPase domain-containing protein [Schaalia sp. lx-100]
MTPAPFASPQRSHERTIRRRVGTDEELISSLHRLDNRNYGSYKSVIGTWDYGDFTIAIDHIQADPYAPPSSVRLLASPSHMGLPDESLASHHARVATADFLIRTFIAKLGAHNSQGAIHIARIGQEILQRSTATVTSDRVEIRFQVQLPARGRTIMGHAAARLFDEDIPDLALDLCDFISDNADVHKKTADLLTHIHTYLDHQHLQTELTRKKWVAFIADGAMLARRSGVSQEPLADGVPFTSPDTLRAHVDLPYAGRISGMAIPEGVTIIVGGGYHGKSTLLSAIQRGVYAHIHGDGRELVATLPDAMKVRAADGRAVTGVDVSPFISHLPAGTDTRDFSTVNASGSTSQAAAIMEAIEFNVPVLLLDEDTCATNLLIRDSRMRALVEADREPITPFVDRVRSFAHDYGVSTIMVMGGSGDYLDVADHVLMLDTYHCYDVTNRAREVVAQMPRPVTHLDVADISLARTPLRSRGSGDKPRTKVSGTTHIQLDKQNVDLSDLEQIVDQGQTEAIAWGIRMVLEHLADAKTPLSELLVRMERLINSEGLDTLTKAGARPYPAFLARPRRVDLGAAISRVRHLTLVRHDV